jgi:hypothetical protein
MVLVFVIGANRLAAELRAESRLLQSRCREIRPPQA